MLLLVQSFKQQLGHISNWCVLVVEVRKKNMILGQTVKHMTFREQKCGETFWQMFAEVSGNRTHCIPEESMKSWKSFKMERKNTPNHKSTWRGHSTKKRSSKARLGNLLKGGTKLTLLSDQLSNKLKSLIPWGHSSKQPSCRSFPTCFTAARFDSNSLGEKKCMESWI